jgi:hypothetical protein
MDAAVNETQNALGIFFRFKLPNGIELNVPEFGIENRLNTWLTDKTKVVDKTSSILTVCCLIRESNFATGITTTEKIWPKF